MLGEYELVAFVPTTDLERARAFYEGVLGLPLVEESPIACVVRAGRTTVRVTLVDALTPAPWTVLGWSVPAIDAAVLALRDRGVAFEVFAGMDQDELGVWTAPGGARVAWFKDPDGNVLSLTEPAAGGDDGR
jgi:catechol 2,3-dioxygenase-like lactoylglutathione lyase family enzyme